MTDQTADHYTEQAAADAALAGELFTAEAEFPGSSPSRRTSTHTLPDIATYQPVNAPSATL